MKKHLFSIVSVTICLLLAIICISASDVYYSFNESTGEVVFTGTGDMPNFHLLNSPPWNNIREKIQSVTVSEGITSVGSYAFDAGTWGSFGLLKNVNIARSVTSIGDAAFYGCTALKTIKFYGDAPEFEGTTTVFYGVTATAYYQKGTSGWTDEAKASAGGSITWIETCFDHNPVEISHKDGEYIQYTCNTCKEVWTTSGQCGDNLNWKIFHNNIDTSKYDLVIEGNGQMYDYNDADSVPWASFSKDIVNISLPNQITGIGSYAFYKCTSSSKIVLPSSIETIGAYAFMDCAGIYTLNGLDNLTEIGARAFCSCENLSQIVLGPKVTYIGAYAFNDCKSLTGEIVIPKSVAYISSYAFYNSRGFSKLVFDCDNVIISNEAFSYCSGLETVVFNGEADLGYRAFCYSGLSQVILGEKMQSIGKEAFIGCGKLYEIYNLSPLTLTVGATDNGYVAYHAKIIHTSLDEPKCFYTTKEGYVFFKTNDFCQLLEYNGEEVDLILPETYCGMVYSIASGAFSNNVQIQTLYIPDTVKEIESSSFSGCTSLTAVKLPNQLSIIAPSLFSGCTSLKSITIPESVTEIMSRSFSGCYNMETVYFNAINCASFSSSFTFFERTDNTNVDVTVYIGKNVEVIPTYIFYQCEFLKQVIFEENSACISIGNYAFKNSGITSINLPEGLVRIGKEAFYVCSKLENIALPSSLSEVGGGAFLNCALIKEITIPNKLTIIPERMFYGCTSLTELYLHDEITEIGSSAFFGIGISSVEFGPKLVKLGGFAFSKCKSLTSIKFSGSKPEFGYSTWTQSADTFAEVTANAYYPMHNTTWPESPWAGGNLTWQAYNDGNHSGGEANCTAKATCEICGESYGDINPLVHISTNTFCEYNGDATHTIRYACCNALFATEMCDPSESTCLEKQTCTVCDAVLVEKLGHNYKATVTAPTCTEQGYTTHTCERCNDSYVDTYVNAKGHTAGAAATCTTDQTCTVCGTVLAEKLGHNYKSTVTAPTCTEQGYTTHTCERCNDSYVDTYVNAKGHTAGAAATCTTDQTCTVCGTVLAEKLGHDYKATVVAPTENSEGYTLHECSRCHDSYKDSFVPATAKKGDLNGDDQIDSSDAIYLLYNSLFGDEKYPVEQHCDYTRDGNIDSQDAIYLLYNSLFGDEKYPLNPSSQQTTVLALPRKREEF